MKNNKINKQHLPICRITSLRGFDGVLLGRDLSGVFKNGHVYDVKEIDGVFILSDLGPHAVAEHLKNESGLLTGTIQHYAMSAMTFISEKESQMPHIIKTQKKKKCTPKKNFKKISSNSKNP